MALLWEQHCYLPLSWEARVGSLSRYQQSAGKVVSVNVGYAPHNGSDVLGLLHAFRRGVSADERLLLIDAEDDIAAAEATGRVGVIFDLEDCGPLEGELGRIGQFYDLGVRTMVLTYNRRNAAGSGCLDAEDEGLTAYGRAVVQEMNLVGMVVDGSHCGARTGLELSAASTVPMIYSHSCMRSVWGPRAQHHRRPSQGLRRHRRRRGHHRRRDLPRSQRRVP